MQVLRILKIPRVIAEGIMAFMGRLSGILFLPAGGNKAVLRGDTRLLGIVSRSFVLFR